MVIVPLICMESINRYAQNREATDLEPDFSPQDGLILRNPSVSMHLFLLNLACQHKCAV